MCEIAISHQTIGVEDLTLLGWERWVLGEQHLASWSCLERRHFQGTGEHLHEGNAHFCAVWKTGRGAEPGAGKVLGSPFMRDD